MSRITWLVMLLGTCFSSLLAEVPYNWGKEELLARRLVLRTQAMNQTTDSSDLNMGSKVPGQKSIGKAVVFSAVLPGSGQFYAKSYVKAAVFLAIEVTAWAVYFSNTKKGDKRDSEFKQFAGENWSEYRYWSYVNWVGLNNEIYSELVVPENYVETVTAPNGGVWHLINETYFNANKDEILSNLREIEQNEFSHRLPKTTTQQYYEMIGKYPGQFGNSWSDASFDRTYSGPDNITTKNNFYMETRDQANRFYDYAQYGLMAVLINHVVSAVDAGFTTRNYNRRLVKMEMSYKNLRYKTEYVNMFGVNLSW
jgi:hypothetical protein